MIGHWGPRTRNLDVEWPAPPVDDDPDGEWLAQAIEQHRDNWDVEIGYAEPYRDFKSPELTWARHGPSGVLDDIRDASVPAYHFNGWFDIFVLDTVLWWANYRGPQKMTIGAWPHAAVADQRLMEEMQRLTAIERHRWFDHWLKGIDNGVMDEPPIHYALMIEPGSWEWRSADRWPTTGTSQRTLYLAGGPSGTAGSVNDGNLLNEPPTGTLAGHDTYQVDPTTTTGTTTRWDNAMAAARFMSYPDMSDNDAKSMTWTTGPLDHDLAIVGHPVVTLYIESTTGDADIVALLEEVDAEGRSHYVTEGVLRASHRKLGEAPWDNLGLPYQRSYSDDVEPLPDDGPAELRMDLHPTATVFNAGHRLRLTVMGADADNLEAPASLPTLRVHRNEAFPSRIDLPALSAGPPPN
jgi:putative CocE/NonD family hydrolase